MRVLGNSTKVNELSSMLVELDMDFHQNLNIAMDKKDKATAFDLSQLRDCIEKILEGIY